MKLKLYKLKRSVINESLWLSNVIIMIDSERENGARTTLEHKGEKYYVYIMPNTKNKADTVSLIVNSYLKNSELSEVLFTNARLDIENSILLSQTLNIKFQYLKRKDRAALILKHFYKMKNIIKKYGKKKVLFHYNFFDGRHTIDTMIKKVTTDFDDYFYIGEFKKAIRLYKKEILSDLDLNNPSLSDNMLLKYISNYFDKLVVISYDELTIKDFIVKYYNTDVQAKDHVSCFINNFIFTYQEMTSLRFTYENKYHYKGDIVYTLVKKIKHERFVKRLDEVLKNKENFNNIMFMFEILEISKTHSDKKNIINYIAAIELLLTHSPKNEKDTISRQFIEKATLCLEKTAKNDFSSEELKNIYSYRSKVIHGDYSAIEKVLKRLSKLSPYFLNPKALEDEIYLTRLQMVEELLEKRAKKLFKEVFILFLKEDKYINDLKAEIIAE